MSVVCGYVRWYGHVLPRKTLTGIMCVFILGFDVGAGGVEVDVIYIAIIMSAEYTEYLVPYKSKVQPGKCTTELACTDT